MHPSSAPVETIFFFFFFVAVLHMTCIGRTRRHQAEMHVQSVVHSQLAACSMKSPYTLRVPWDLGGHATVVVYQGAPHHMAS